MPEQEPVIEHSNERFHIELRGFDHIPEAERNMSLPQVDFLWLGTSVNLLSFTLGALTIAMGPCCTSWSPWARLPRCEPGCP